MRSRSVGNRPNYSCRSIRSPQRGITSRKIIEHREAALLSPGAALSLNSRDRELWLGRCQGVHNKLVSTNNTPVHTRFSADRERIHDSKPFRELAGKTQVLIRPKDETVTTRLFHTIQVAQLARTVGRALGLNEDLIEAIALGHDLGHTPFGHAGERALSRFSRGYLGHPFLHNRQSLWVVEILYRWMDLSFEVKDGILRHSGKIERSTKPWIPRADAHLTDSMKNLVTMGDYWKVMTKVASADQALANLTDSKKNPTTLEGCLVKVMDKVASAAQDFADLLDAGLVPNGPFAKLCSLLGLKAKYVTTNPHALHELFLEDLIRNSISNSKEKDAISFSPVVFEGFKFLKGLVDGIIRGKIEFEHEGEKITIEQSPKIKAEDDKAIQIVSALFRRLFNYYLVYGHKYFEDPATPYYCVPFWPLASSDARNAPFVKQMVALKTIDEIAEMTDRQALEMYEQEVLPRSLL